MYLLYDFLWQRKYHGELKLNFMYILNWANHNSDYEALMQPVIASAPYVIWGSIQLSKIMSVGGTNHGSMALPDYFLPIPSISIAPYDFLVNNATDGLRWHSDYDEFDDDFILDETLDFDLQDDSPWSMSEENDRWGGFSKRAWQEHSPFPTADEDYYHGEPYDRDFWGGFDTDYWTEQVHLQDYARVSSVLPNKNGAFVWRDRLY